MQIHYIANFAISKNYFISDEIVHSCIQVNVMKLAHYFLVGSAHVRSQATVHAFKHAAHAVCMRAEDIDSRFKECHHGAHKSSLFFFNS